MAKAPYMPTDDNGKNNLLKNIAGKLPTYAATVGVTPAEVASTKADSAYFDYVLNGQQQFISFGQQWTAYKNAARDGSDASLGLLPAAPALGTAPAQVDPGIFLRLADLIARIKRHPNYTDAIGQDLGIIGAQQTMDLNSLKPLLDVQLQAGKPNVGWTKQGMDSLETWVDRDGKGFVFLAIDTVPDYLDTAPLPAPGQSAIWKYKAIYRLNDEQVGQWSDVVSIAVAG